MVTDKDGAAQIAHAIRRSSALYLAVVTSHEGTSDEALFQRADTFAAWIRGKAGPPPDDFIGINPWAQD